MVDRDWSIHQQIVRAHPVQRQGGGLFEQLGLALVAVARTVDDVFGLVGATRCGEDLG